MLGTKHPEFVQQDAFIIHVPIYRKRSNVFTLEHAIQIRHTSKDSCDTYFKTPQLSAELSWAKLQRVPAMILISGTGAYEKKVVYYLDGRHYCNTAPHLYGMRTFHGKALSDDVLQKRRLFENHTSIFMADEHNTTRSLVFDHYICFPESIPCAVPAKQEQIIDLQRAVVQRLVRNIHAIYTSKHRLLGTATPHKNLSISPKILSNCIFFEID